MQNIPRGLTCKEDAFDVDDFHRSKGLLGWTSATDLSTPRPVRDFYRPLRYHVRIHVPVRVGSIMFLLLKALRRYYLQFLARLAVYDDSLREDSMNRLDHSASAFSPPKHKNPAIKCNKSYRDQILVSVKSESDKHLSALSYFIELVANPHYLRAVLSLLLSSCKTLSKLRLR